VNHLKQELEAICEDLLARTSAQRTTVRVDSEELGLGVDLAAAEALAAGTSSIANDCSIDQRSLDTIRWLETNRRVLVQNDFSQPPLPPVELVEIYGTKAQVLSPILAPGALWGWVSVHSAKARPWSDEDVAHAERAAANVGSCVNEALHRLRGR